MSIKEGFRKAWAGAGKVFMILFAASMIFAVAAGLYGFNNRPAWNPLGNYPTQIIKMPKEEVTLSTPNGAEIRSLPTIHVPATGDIKIPVEGTKCNNTEFTVNTQGHTFYEFTSPPVESTPSGNPVAAGKRTPGCDTRTFNNIVPAGVAEKMRARLQNGPFVARIYGVETPIDDNGKEGLAKRWETEEFAVVQG